MTTASEPIVSDPAEACPGCGFVWATVPPAAVGPRLVRAAADIVDTLAHDPAPAGVRPAPARWSALEYAAHVRDVLYHLRDRVVIALVENDPEFKPLYRDQRVDLGLYRGDDVALVAAELPLAAALFARTFAALDETQLERTCRYAYPTLMTRTVRWIGQQAVHEAEHHRADIIENLSS